MTVGPAGREPPDVWIRQSVADLRVVAGSNRSRPARAVAAGRGQHHVLFGDPRDVELLRQVSGRLLFELEGRRRRRWALDVGFGKAGVSAGRPRTTLRVDSATFEGVRSGSIPPMQALLDGRLKLEGDRGLAMQVLLLFGSRLARR